VIVKVGAAIVTEQESEYTNGPPTLAESVALITKE
jgi:hypothetical protein